MKCNNMAVLRETLVGMETRQLDEMLLAELRKEPPDGELVRLIGSILRERDPKPKADANLRQAWERYLEKSRPVHKRPRLIGCMLVKAAALVLTVFTLTALMPQEVRAMNFFERFMEWTEDVFSLLSPAEPADRQGEYVFRSDNPGLQEVYEAVVALGVTVPVVPTWLPEGYELVEFDILETPAKTVLRAGFTNYENDMVYELDIYSDNVTHSYYKDSADVQNKEYGGITHTIIHNHDLLVMVWTRKNIECTLVIDCQEDVLNRILESIYTVEVN